MKSISPGNSRAARFLQYPASKSKQAAIPMVHDGIVGSMADHNPEGHLSRWHAASPRAGS